MTDSPYKFDLNLMRDRMTVAFKGKTFEVVCYQGDGIYHPSVWSFMDEVETRDAWWDIQPGDLVLDVGADFGSYTLPALAMGATVYSWSPPFKLPRNPLEADTLRLSIAANGWADNSVVFDYGLWSDVGWLASYDGPRPAKFYNGHKGSGFVQAIQGDGGYGGFVQAIQAIQGEPGHCSAFPVGIIPPHVSPFEASAWLKIDTEGSEEEILKGAESFIRLRKPTIILEYHELTMPGCEARLDALLESYGYEKVDRRPHHTIAHGLYKPKVAQ